MITHDVDAVLQRIVDLIVEAARPSKLILFGSQARGDADEGSDLDIVVILPTVENRRAEMVRLQRLLAPAGLPVDILVFSAKDVVEWGDVPGTVLYPALREGVVLYDAA